MSFIIIAFKLEPSSIFRATEDVKPAPAAYPADSKACVIVSCVAAMLVSLGANSGTFSVKTMLFLAST